MKTLIQKIHQAIETPSVNDSHFIDNLEQYFAELYHLKAEHSGLFDLSKNDLIEIIQMVFECRLKLNKMPNEYLLNEEKEDDELLARVYDMNRALRYLEDYALEIVMQGELSENHTYTTLQGKGPYFMVSPNQHMRGLEDLQSGDVILTRGSAYTSAAIARIGVNDTQFSHLSFIYRNPKERGKLYTVEAHIEIGSVVEPMDIHINQKNSRTVIYRFDDTMMAHQAAEYMFQKVKSHSDKGKNIEYNFSMQYNDASKLFCSQVIYDGFYTVSNKQLDVPKFKTKFNKELIPFLNKMGIPATAENIGQMETFGPGDIEYDPRFTLIAEWKDPKQLSDSRLKDAVLTKMFAWMEKENYHIHQPLSVKIMSRLTWLLRRMPLLKKLVVKKLPLNMTIDQLNVFLTLDKIGKVMGEEILKAQKASTHPLSMKEIFDILEAFKNKDRQNKNPKFHQWFHPREE